MLRRQCALVVEIIALRQQLATFRARNRQPRVRTADRVFWVVLRRRPEAPQSWLTFLRNHREVIAAMDLFVVCTATFRLLYVLFVIRHGRRPIVHFNVTEHPTAAWVVQQIREAFPFDTAPRHFIFDRDSIFCAGVVAAVKAIGAKPTRTAYRAPWQNGVAERWVQTARRDLLDHVVVLNERHLVRLLRDFVEGYYHPERTHLGLGKETPARRAIEHRPSPGAKVEALLTQARNCRVERIMRPYLEALL
jgi:transposase InsO family protein